MKGLGVDTCFLRRSEADDQRTIGLRLETMHRVRGIVRDRVTLAGVKEVFVPFGGSAGASATRHQPVATAPSVCIGLSFPPLSEQASAGSPAVFRGK